MPELPEVETITRELNHVMPGARIQQVQVGLPKIVKLPLREFRRKTLGVRVRKVHRRAKLGLFDLSNGQTMVIHLKMSGQLIWEGKRKALIVGGHPIPGGTEQLPNKYSHVILVTSKGTLFFNDQRQFGFVRTVKTSELELWLESQGYGPEPLSEDFTLSLFTEILARHRVKRVKPTIMDQHVIAGIGNIYADEACHYAKIRPNRRIRSLTVTERKALYRGIQYVLALSIRHNGTSASDYRRSNGEKGSMNKFLRVYGRDGLACRRCGYTIVKTVLAQRGTHFCPHCQH